MSNPNQLGFTDGLLSARRKSSKQAQQLQQIDAIVDWEPLVKAVQLMDRLSFQQFVGIHLEQDVPEFTTIWRFKQSLIAHQLDLKIFELISQHKRNTQRARVRAAVEHPFAWLKSKANFGTLRAKNLLRNQLAFIFGCIGCNLSRALYLLKKQRVTLA